MKTNDFDSVFEKQYAELTDAEKLDMKELFSSEEEFVRMQAMLRYVDATLRDEEQELEPSPQIKQRLDHLFVQTYQPKGILWYNKVGLFMVNPEKNWYNQNVVRFAAILLVALISLPFLKMVEPQSEQQQFASEDKMTAENTTQPAAVSQADKTKTTTPFADPSAAKAESSLESNQKFETFSPMQDDADEEAAPREEIAVLDLEDRKAMTSTFATQPGSTHPDGIFMGTDKSLSAKDIPAFTVKDNVFILDVLTAAY